MPRNHRSPVCGGVTASGLIQCTITLDASGRQVVFGGRGLSPEHFHALAKAAGAVLSASCLAAGPRRGRSPGSGRSPA